MQLVTIGIPTLNSRVTNQCAATLIGLMADAQNKYSLNIIFVNNTYIHESRNDIVRQAKLTNSTHLLFLDSDMSVDGKGLSKLISHDKDIIGANYYKRNMNKESNVYLYNEKGDFVPMNVPETASDIFRCGGIGAGFLLINMNVFNKIKNPYFYFGYSIEKQQYLGEDLAFCYKANQAGLEIWCDPSIKTKHVGEYEY
jgi:hypothetical protein